MSKMFNGSFINANSERFRVVSDALERTCEKSEKHAAANNEDVSAMVLHAMKRKMGAEAKRLTEGVFRECRNDGKWVDVFFRKNRAPMSVVFATPDGEKSKFKFDDWETLCETCAMLLNVKCVSREDLYYKDSERNKTIRMHEVISIETFRNIECVRIFYDESIAGASSGPADDDDDESKEREEHESQNGTAPSNCAHMNNISSGDDTYITASSSENASQISAEK